jgi:hypothetical protein
VQKYAISALNSQLYDLITNRRNYWRRSDRIFAGFCWYSVTKNTSATKSASAIAATNSMSQWYSNLGSSEQNSNLFRNFMADPSSMSEEQQFQVIMHFHAAMLILQNNFYLEN